MAPTLSLFFYFMPFSESPNFFYVLILYVLCILDVAAQQVSLRGIITCSEVTIQTGSGTDQSLWQRVVSLRFSLLPSSPLCCCVCCSCCGSACAPARPQVSQTEPGSPDTGTGPAPTPGPPVWPPLFPEPHTALGNRCTHIQIG